MHYLIEQADSYEILQDFVNDALHQGYSLHGGLTVTATGINCPNTDEPIFIYTQAMIKNETAQLDIFGLND